MPSSLHRSKSKPLQFPNHTSNLILMLMNARNPPLSPLVQDRHSELVSQPSQPGHSASNWNTIINITLSNPNPKSSLHQDRIQPVTSISIHGVVSSNVITAGLESLEGNVHRALDADLVEEMADTKHILADDVIGHEGSPSSVGKSDEFSPFGNIYFLIEALGIEIEHAGVGSIELLISNFSNISTGLTLISKDASSSNIIILRISIIPMIIKILILIDAHIDVISWLIALPRVSACVVDHDTLEVDSHFSVGKLVSSEDLVGQVGDVDACIALTSQVELIFFQVREFVEEC